MDSLGLSNTVMRLIERRTVMYCILTGLAEQFAWSGLCTPHQ